MTVGEIEDSQRPNDEATHYCILFSSSINGIPHPSLAIIVNPQDQQHTTFSVFAVIALVIVQLIEGLLLLAEGHAITMVMLYLGW